MITATGIGSGLDIEGLVRQLVAAERSPVENRLLSRESALKTEISAFGLFKSILSNFEGTLKALTQPSSFSQKTATVSDATILGAQAGESAQPGSYSISISQLAGSQILASAAVADPEAALGTGTLAIRFGTTDYDAGTDTYNSFTPNTGASSLSLQIDAQNNSLAGIRDAINQADAGVSATIVNDGSGYRLLLTSKNSGAKNSLEVVITGDGDGNDLDAGGLSLLAFNSQATHMTQTRAAQDAQLDINGLAVSSPSNRLENVIDGVTLNLKAVTGASPVTLSVAKNQAVVTQNIQAFVAAYNNLIGTVNKIASYNPDTEVAGVLQGDFTVRSMVSQIRQVMSGAVSGLDASFNRLSEIGISTQADGTLALDSTKLAEVLGSDQEGIAGLFGAENGIATSLYNMLGAWLETGGVLDERTNGLERRVASIADSMAALERRMTTVEARYRAQFNALDSLMSQLQSTSSFLNRQLAALPGAAPVERKK